MKLILAYILLLAAVGFASAGSCTTPVYHAPHVKKVVVAQVVTVPVFQFAALPVYGGAYVPPAVAVTPAPVAVAPTEDFRKRQSDLEQILGAIKQVDSNTRSIDERVKVLEAKVNGQQQLPPPAVVPPKDKTPDLTPKTPLSPQVQAPVAPGVGVLNKHCAACHGVTADKTGGDFAMFDNAGKLLELNDRQWRKVSTKMASQKMPPEKDGKGTLLAQPTQEEYASVVAFIETLK